MKKSVFDLFLITLFLSCPLVIVAQGKSTPSSFPNKKLPKINQAQIHNIDESRSVDRSAAGQKEKDKIESLPGQPKVQFNQYGGHVIANATAGRALYYYFAEAQGYRQDASPLLLWINNEGSSLGIGAMEEMGPFRVYSDGKTLYQNNYAWNQVANVLFLETPAGVGFSYSNTTDYATGDEQTANDNYAFLANWLNRFPEYKTRSIYLGGERYGGGHLVPQLAQVILKQNKRPKSSSNIIINLKGITIGNANINEETQDIGKYEYWGSHALISDDSTYNILKHCNFSDSAPDPSTNYLCKEILDINRKNFDAINRVNIYAPVCPSWRTTTENPNKASIFEYDPCSDMYVSAYLNRPDVKSALHADGASKIDWDDRSDVIDEQWKDSPSTVLPTIKDLMNNGIRVWICNGDLDGWVSVTSAQLAIKVMKLDIQEPWRPWYSTTRKHREVGGYTQGYKGNLTFATVRGAGQHIPSDQPERALTLISSFLAGKKLPIS